MNQIESKKQSVSKEYTHQSFLFEWNTPLENILNNTNIKTLSNIASKYPRLQKSFVKKQIMAWLWNEYISNTKDQKLCEEYIDKMSMTWLFEMKYADCILNWLKYKIYYYSNISQQQWICVNDMFISDLKYLKSKWIISESIQYSFFDFLTVYDIYAVLIEWEVYYYFDIKKESNNNIWVIPFTTTELIDLVLLKEFIQWKLYIDKPWFKPWYEPITQHIYLDTLWVWVYFNYTVNLRASIFSQWKYSKLYAKKKKFLQDWQYYWYLMQWWISTEVCARRFWKTTRMVHDLLVELWSIQTYRRPRRLFYVSSTEKKTRKFTKDLIDIASTWVQAWVYQWKWTESTLFFNKYDNKGKKIPWQFLWTIEIFSANEQDIAVGDDPDYIQIDEYERIKWEQGISFLTDIMPIVATERVRLVKTSTINKNGLVTPFVKWMWDGEQQEEERISMWMWIKDFLLWIYHKYFDDIDSDKIVAWDKKEIDKLKNKDWDAIKDSLLKRRECTTRIPGKCNEILSKDEMNDSIEILMKEWYTTYLTEWECRLPEEVDPIDIWSSLVSKKEIGNKFDFLLHVVDPRDSWSDRPAWVYMTFDQWKVVILAEEEYTWDIISVSQQVEKSYLKNYNEYIRWYTDVWDNSIPKNKFLLFDARGIWAWLKTHLNNKQIPSVRYMSTSSYKASIIDWQCNVWKMYAYDFMKNMFAFWNILVINDLEKTILSLKHFKPFLNESTWSISAKWDTWFNDDFANAVMMGIWYIVEKMWYKSQLTSWKTLYQLKKENTQKQEESKASWWNLRPEDFDEDLYQKSLVNNTNDIENIYSEFWR